MSTATVRDALWAKVARLIDRLADGSRDDRARDELLCEALSWQAQAVVPYRRYLAGYPERLRPHPRSPDDFLALPTDVFRFARVASYPESDDQRVFRTSGTTSGAPGCLYLRDLSLYDQAAHAAARFALFPEWRRLRLILLAPLSDSAPESSLSYMLTRFIQWFGTEPSRSVWRGNGLDFPALVASLDDASKDGQPIALLGASFAFVHAEDNLGTRFWKLPNGSRIMLTGGFKGRSRQVERGVLDQALVRRFGVAPDWIIQEYGMTELSSQMYETSLRHAMTGQKGVPRVLWAPGWMRGSVIDPDRLTPVDPGVVGLLRIDDLSNIDSVCSIQTSDLARCVAGGFEVLGRAQDAPLRGCSLAVEEALER
jgi:hypothetical protein